MLALFLLFFSPHPPVRPPMVATAATQCAQKPGMVLVEGFCVPAADHVVVTSADPAKTTPGPAPIRARKPAVRLTCSPRIEIAAFRPILVSASLRVMDPGERLWCPRVVWTINGQSAGTHEGDCKPYEDAVAERGSEPEVWTEDRPKYFKFGPGSYVITAALMKAGRILTKTSCSVMIKGGDIE